MEEEQLYDRIGETDFNPTYVDGQTFLHTDVNKIVSITKEGVNENYHDIQKLQNGTKSVGNAIQFDGATLSKYLDEPLQANDAKVPTSQQVKEYVDGLFSDFNAPVRGVDYWTEDDKQEIIDEASEGVEAEIDGVLENYAKLTDIPSDISSFTNDSGYLVEDNLQMVDTADIQNNSQIINGTGYARLDIIYGDSKQNGTPMPNSKVDIDVVTGDLEIGVSDADGTNEQSLVIALGKMELCKIGNYTDYIYKKNGKWYKHCEIMKVILDDSDTWTNTYGANLFGTVRKLESNPPVGQALCLCNYFNYNSRQSQINANTVNGDFCVQYASGAGNLYFKNTDYSDVSDWKNYLKNLYDNDNPVIFYYPLKNPFDEEITDYALLSSLNEFENFYLYRNETNFNIENNNLSPKIEITYAITDRDMYSKEETNDLIKNNNNKLNDNIQLIMPKNLDAGGDITIVKTKNKIVLIDTFTSIKANEVLNFLSNNNVSHIDILMISHYHSDHIGNVVNLINKGYIDSKTIVYQPDYTSLYSTSDTNAYNNMIQAFDAKNITYLVPTEGSSIKIDDVKVTFYNSELSIFENYTGSNDCSMVCKFEYGDKSILFTGDIVKDACTRLSNLASLDNKVDIYKFAHHGIEASERELPLIKKLTPSYFLLPAHVNHFINNNITQSQNVLYASQHNLPIYSCFNNTEDIIIDISKNNISVKKGLKTTKLGSRRIVQTFYVDSSTTNKIQNGTEDYPFNDLPQALAVADGLYSKTVIYLADGDYCLGDNNKYNGFINNQTVEIYGNETDNTAVKIHRPITLYNKSFLVIKDLTILNDVAPFSVYNSDCFIDNCIVTNSLEDPTIEYSIFVRQKSRLSIINSTISYSVIGLDCSDSELCLTGCDLNNLSTAIKLTNSIFKENNNSYTSITTRKFNNTNSGNLNQLIKRDTVFSGDIYNQTDPFNLSKNVTNYNCLLILTGVANTNTLYTSVLIPYSSFADNTIFNVPTLNGNGTLEFTDSGNKAIWTGSNTLRKIYGLNISTE